MRTPQLLPEDRPAWFVLETVAELDLETFHSAYRRDGHGRAARDPQMMVALLAEREVLSSPIVLLG